MGPHLVKENGIHKQSESTVPFSCSEAQLSPKQSCSIHVDSETRASMDFGEGSRASPTPSFKTLTCTHTRHKNLRRLGWSPEFLPLDPPESPSAVVVPVRFARPDSDTSQCCDSCVALKFGTASVSLPFIMRKTSRLLILAHADGTDRTDSCKQLDHKNST